MNEKEQEIISIAKQYGFETLGEIHGKLDTQLFWNQKERLQLCVIKTDGKWLFKGIKSYYVLGVNEQGEELRTRDIAGFNEYLQTHFPEMHISFYYLRDITNTMALDRIQQRKFQETGKKVDVGIQSKQATVDELRKEVADFGTQAKEQEEVFKLEEDPALKSMIKENCNSQKRTSEEKVNRAKQIEFNIALTRKLQQEYINKGSAASFIFSISSNLHATNMDNLAEAGDIIANIVKELKELDSYQIRQKLSYGKFNIPIEEVSEPVTAWLSEWAMGYTPRQLEKLGPEFDGFRRLIESYFVVTPSEDITINGITKDEKKLFGAKALQTFFENMDKVQEPQLSQHIPLESSKTAWLGNIMNEDAITKEPYFLILIIFGFLSGITRSGKSYGARVIGEGAIIAGIKILVLDPGNQWIGLFLPENRKEILDSYKEFGLTKEQARGFDIDYYAPFMNIGADLPKDIPELWDTDKSIVISFKGAKKRCGSMRAMRQNT